MSKLISDLADYIPAHHFCSQQYPIIPTGPATATIAVCKPEATPAARRDISYHDLPDSRPNIAKAFDKLRDHQDEKKHDDADGGPRRPPPALVDDGQQDRDHHRVDQARAFTRLQDARGPIQHAFCICISPPPPPPASLPVTVTVTCPEQQYCTASGICKPRRTCTNAARCDSSSYCLEAAAGACFCHPDVDDDTASGYCMSGGPAARGGCPEVYEDCAANADCAGAKVCILACCREEPFCVDLDDYSPQTPSAAGRMVVKRGGGSVGGVNPSGVM
jgi:hypothetical protein